MYRVVQIVGWPKAQYSSNLDEAARLREDYGLDHLSIDTVDRMWSEHSLGGWQIPDKESVEFVFQVILEKIDE